MSRARAVGHVAILLLSLVLALGSCALVGTSRKDRMMRFEVGLNENRPELYQDFFAGATSDYDTLRTTDVGQTWDVWFPPGYPTPGTYTLEFVENLRGSVDGVLATVSGPAEFGSPKSLELRMVRVGLDWYLAALELDGTVIVQ
jgi:hypothetical protein